MSNIPVQKEGSVYGHMLRGSAWALLMRWSIRGIGFISILVLARLLTPSDFGVVAMGSLVVGLLSVFAEFTVGAYVIREKEVTREICDTAWTIGLLQGIVVASALFISAPMAVWYFDEPRVLPVIHILAGVAVIQSVQNIGMTLVRKELDFAKDFRFEVYKRLSKFLVTVALAFLWRSYWALVVGVLVGSIVSVVLSYRMHPYRPRLSLAKGRELLAFGFSMALSNVAKYFNGKLDVLLVGGMGSTAFLGIYNVASEISSMATSGIVVPIGRGLFPSYAKISHDRAQLKLAYLNTLRAIAVLCFAAGVGLSAVADDAVIVILGENWRETAPMLKWLALYALFDSILLASFGQIFVVLGREWAVAALRWGRLALFAPAVIAAGLVWGVEAIPVAATIVAAVWLPVIGYAVERVVGVTLVEMASAMWRPAVAAMFMVGVVTVVQSGELIPAVRLLLEIVLGAGAYSLALIALWIVAGRPDGVESALYSMWRRKRGMVRT